MKLKLTLVAAALLAAVAAPAAAQTASPFGDVGVYGTIGYTGVFAEGDGDIDGDLTLGGVTGRLGAKFGRFVGVEGEYTLGVQDDELSAFGQDVNVELDQQYAGYLIGTYPFSDRFEAFARVGYGKVEFEVEFETFDVSFGSSTDAFAYGGGVQYFFDGLNGVRGDYTYYDLDGGDAVDSLSVSYVRRF